MPPTSNQTALKDSLKIRVLLVNDNKVFLRAATDFLQRNLELTVGGAGCGGEEPLA